MENFSDEFVKCEKDHDIIFYDSVAFGNRCPLCLLIEGLKILKIKVEHSKERILNEYMQ